MKQTIISDELLEAICNELEEECIHTEYSGRGMYGETWFDFYGTLRFDDLRVYREGIDANVFLLEPNYAAFPSGNGHFRMKVHVPEKYRKSVVLAEFSLGGRTLYRRVLKPDASGEISGDLGNKLPAGEGLCRLTLADCGERIKLKTKNIPFSVLRPAEPPRGAVRFDRDGRMYVDGELKLPLGIFYSSTPDQREDHYRYLAGSPFNFIMDYSVLSMASASERDPVAVIRRGLDRLHELKLKVIVCLTAFYYAPGYYMKQGWAGEKGTLNMTRRMVESFKNHPAVLGWYLTDELSEEQLAVPVAMRQLINRLDPYHPTFTLSNLPSAMPNYTESGDVFMFDTYALTLKKNGTDRVEKEIAAYAARPSSGVPVWSVTQAFNWGTSNVLNRKDRADFDRYIEPTEEDIRSISLLSAIYGAQGFSFFVFPFPWRAEVKRKYLELGLFGYQERLWHKISGAAGTLKRLEPYLLGTSGMPAVQVRNFGGKPVRARAWTDARGRVAVVIVGTGKNADAEIVVPGNLKLKSLHGRAVELGNGRYRYRSPDLSSDVLL